jgi:Uma2 family endonuclease
MIVERWEEIHYPDTDGEPIAESTIQFDAISELKWGLEELFASNPLVFIAGDLLWYPIEGDNRTRRAPDVMVVFGRPKGERLSYLQWREGHVVPQVVFEVHSPNETAETLQAKRDFDELHGVEEYYEIDPALRRAYGWLRQDGRLVSVPDPRMNGFVSPRLGIIFDQNPAHLVLRRPDGEPLEPVLDRFRRGRLAEEQARRASDRALAAERDREAERLRAEEAERDREAERLRAETERYRAEKAERERDIARQREAAERERAAAEQARAERLAELLRRSGIDPDAPAG